jgi:hypothetical protein
VKAERKLAILDKVFYYTGCPKMEFKVQFRHYYGYQQPVTLSFCHSIIIDFIQLKMHDFSALVRRNINRHTPVGRQRPLNKEQGKGRW